MSFSNEETSAIFAAADINQDGEIAYTEFVSLMIPSAGNALNKFRKSFGSAASAKNAFNKFDVNGDAEISYQELKNGVGSGFSENEVKAVFALGDTDQDGSISFLEFAKLMIANATDVLAKFWKCFRDVKVLRQAFKQFDIDGDGKISKQEVSQGMKKSGRDFTNDDIETLFILADKDGDGQIDFAEFATIMIPTAPERISKLKKKFDTNNDGSIDAAELAAAFKRMDTNNDGAIDSRELSTGLQNSGVCLTDQEVETIFAIADIDGDGQISQDEFGSLLGVEGAAGKPAVSSSGKCEIFSSKEIRNQSFYFYFLKYFFSNLGVNPANIIAKFRALCQTIDEVRAAFKQFDVDGDGNISRQVFRQKKSFRGFSQ